jgi:hypothetical protein
VESLLNFDNGESDAITEVMGGAASIVGAKPQIHRLLTGRFPELPLARLESSLPHDLYFVLGRVSRTDPMERYASALMIDVRPVLESRPLEARRHWLPVTGGHLVVQFDKMRLDLCRIWKRTLPE